MDGASYQAFNVVQNTLSASGILQSRIFKAVADEVEQFQSTLVSISQNHFEKPAEDAGKRSQQAECDSHQPVKNNIDELDETSRDTSLQLATYLISSEETFENDEVATLIWKIFKVKDYEHKDVPIVLRAGDLLLSRLESTPLHFLSTSELANLIFVICGSEVSDQSLLKKWARAEWKEAGGEILKQLRRISHKYVVKKGLLARFFASVWRTDLAETSRKFRMKAFEQISITCDKEALDSAEAVLKMDWDDAFSELNSEIAQQLCFCSFANLAKALENHQESQKSDALDSALNLHEELMRLLYPVLSQMVEVKENFSKAITHVLSMTNDSKILFHLLSCLMEACSWMEWSDEYLCLKNGHLLWQKLFVLLDHLLELTVKNSANELQTNEKNRLCALASPEEDDSGKEEDNILNKLFGETSDAITKKKTEVETDLVKPEKSILFILKSLVYSRNCEENVSRLLVDYYPKMLVAGAHKEISQSVRGIYEKLVKKGVISMNMQLNIATTMLEKSDPASLKILEVIVFAASPKLAAQISNKYFSNLCRRLHSADFPENNRSHLICAQNLLTHLKEKEAVEIVIASICAFNEHSAKDEGSNCLGSIALLIEIILTNGTSVGSPLEKENFLSFRDAPWTLNFAALGISLAQWDDFMQNFSKVQVDKCDFHSSLPLLSYRQLRLSDDIQFSEEDEWRPFVFQFEKCLNVISELPLNVGMDNLKTAMRYLSTTISMANIADLFPEDDINRLVYLCRIWRSSLLNDLPSTRSKLIGNYILPKCSLQFERSKGGDAPLTKKVDSSTLGYTSLEARHFEKNPSKGVDKRYAALQNVLSQLCSCLTSIFVAKSPGDLELADWAQDVSSSTLFPPQVSLNSGIHLKKIMGSDVAMQMQRICVLNIALLGACYNCPTDGDSIGKLQEVMEICSKENSTFALPESLITGLYEIIQDKNSNYLTEVVKKHFTRNISLLVMWLTNARCPLKLFVAFIPTLSHIATLIDKKTFSTTLTEAIDVIFPLDFAAVMSRNDSAKVQWTEKRAMSALNFCSDDQSSPNSDFQKEQSLVRRALTFFSQHGNQQLDHKIIEKTCSLINTGFKSIGDHVNILSGKRDDGLNQEVLFDVVLLTELLTYCVEVSKQVGKARPAAEDMYSSDAEDNKEKETDESVAAVKLENQANSKNFLCTYTSTEQEFINQHWYNCYTCSMVDTMGVCSVCAVNCHRGHDLSYSKEGSFFCDCGAGKCASLVSTKYAPNVRDAVRGRPLLAIPKSTPSPVSSSVYSLQHEINEYGHFLEDLNNLNIQLRSMRDSLSTFFQGVTEANELLWALDDRRRAVLESFSNGSAVSLITDTPLMESFNDSRENNLIPCRRMPEANSDRLKNRDMADVLRFENEMELWVVLPDHTQNNLLMYFIDSRAGIVDGFANARQESETIPFVGKRVEARGDRVVVCGVTDVFVLRFSNEGEIIDRLYMKISDNGLATQLTQNNPIVKATWMNGTDNSLLLAVATIQFVRIYDLGQDADRFVEELVLPLGNVEDICLFLHNGVVLLLVLSTSGYLYEHKLAFPRADNSSFFLTNTVNSNMLSSQGNSGVCAGVSLFYSKTFNMVFLSTEKGAFFANLSEDNSTGSWNWRELGMNAPVTAWRESSGVISALSYPNSNSIHYIYLSCGQILHQLIPLGRQAIGHVSVTSASGESMYSVVLYCDSPTVQLFQLLWSNKHDLWIDGERKEKKIVEVVRKCSEPKELPEEDLVLLNENCKPIERIEWRSKELSAFYEQSDLNTRLSTVSSMPINAVNMERIKLTARVLDTRFVVRALRMEVPAERGPAELKIAGKVYTVSTPVPRIFDIRLTRAQSYSLNPREIDVELRCRNGQQSLTITSLRLLGANCNEMDEAQPHISYQPSLLLPHRLVLSVLDTFTQFATIGLTTEADHVWLHDVCQSHLELRNNHFEVVEAAASLLKTIHLEDTVKCYETKDKLLVKQLFWLSHLDTVRSTSQKSRLQLLERLLPRLKRCLLSRWKMFWEIVRSYFLDDMALVTFLCDQLKSFTSTTAIKMVEMITAIVFGLLAQQSSQSVEITKTYLDLYTNDETYRHAAVLRNMAQNLLYKFAVRCRDDRMLCRLSNEENGLVVLETLGVRPFFSISRVFNSTEQNPIDLAKMNKLMGDIGEAASVCKKEIFESECFWMGDFLRAVLVKVRDEGAKNSLVALSSSATFLDTPSASLSNFGVVLMGQFYPEKLLTEALFLADMIPMDNKLGNLNEDNYRTFLLLRMLSSLVLRWSNSEKKEETATEQSTKSEETTQENVNPSERKPSNKLLHKVAFELVGRGFIERCFSIFQETITFWKTKRPAPHSRRALTPLLNGSTTDAQETPPPIDRVVSPAALENYMASLTDVVLRLPLQLTKITGVQLDPKWQDLLCELVCLHNIPAHRQSKKLLISICKGDKVKYRALRDKFRIRSNLKTLKAHYKHSGGASGYQQLTEMVDMLSTVTTHANVRPEIWRLVCEEEINWILDAACRTTEVLSCSFIDLLVLAIRDTRATGESSTLLADKIIGHPDNNEMLKLITLRYLIGKDEQRRWLIHGLLRSLIQLASRQNQTALIRCLYHEVWPLARTVGMHGAQLIDLISAYSSRLFSSAELTQMSEMELEAIIDISERFEREGHAARYRQMMELGLGWKTMLYATSPCLVCFNRRGATETQKMNSIKQDSRFSSTAMMYKLSSHYEVSRVMLKLMDVKKNKALKRVNLYYCPKSVEAVVELKLCPDLWRRCSTTLVSPNDTDITLSLAVPVVTSSLIVEFAEITDTRLSSELHCPRCSAVVTAQSGLCDNCGENAYQCIKCRSINYDEREPYLCQSCGFCKYARIETFVACRQLPGAQHITCDSERSQCMEEVSKLLINIENTRAHLTTHMSFCESLWIRARPLAALNVHVENNSVGDFFAGAAASTMPANASQAPVSALVHSVNAIKTTHDDLCVQTQQLIAFREELRRYDDPNKSAPILHSAINQGFYSTSKTCFGCMCASTLHSIALLQAAADDPLAAYNLLQCPTLFDLITDLGNKYEPLRDEVHLLFSRLSRENIYAVKKLETLIEYGKVDVSLFAKTLITSPDSLWQHKLKFLVKYAMERPSDPNAMVLALAVLNRYLEISRPMRQRAYRRYASRRQDTYSHGGKKKGGRQIYLRNSYLPSADVVVHWLETDEEWSNCIASSSDSESSHGLAASFTRQSQWIAKCLFSPYSVVRASANRLLVSLSRQPGHEGVAIRLIVNCLRKMGSKSSTVVEQFMHSVHTVLSTSANTKARLFVERFHIWLIKAVHSESKLIHRKEKDESTMDHSFGSRLRNYVELLSLLFSGSCVENILLKAAGDDILELLLDSTIYLKRMIVRRTRAVDASRLALEKLLRRVSWRDSRNLMQAATNSLISINDMSTQAHVVSLMLEVMDPQQKEEEDFLIQIEKDPAQEDFLQGRMTGNPYKSSDSGMGPLMRDIKNKICRDTEMIALLDDDNGMELLVNNMIISLSLSTRAVYEKIWRRAHPGHPMIVIYRMRGLLGDAVETFVSSLGEVCGEDGDEDEALAKITKCLIDSGGMKKILSLLRDADMSNAGRSLLAQLRRLLERVVKTSAGRRALVENNAVGVMIRILRMCALELAEEKTMMLGLEYFRIVETVVSDASLHERLTGVTEDDANWMFSTLRSRKTEENKEESVLRTDERRIHQMLTETIARCSGNVVIGCAQSEDVFVSELVKSLQWERIDNMDNITAREELIWLAEQLASITWHILPSPQGASVKDKILASGIVQKTCDYLTSSHPSLYSATESTEWKSFLNKPSLRLVRCLVRGNEANQMAVATSALPILHRLEHVASEDSIGTLAENVIEALKENAEVAKQIEAVRLETKKKKRQLAMAMRNKQLTKMGMVMGKSGEVKISSRKLNEPPLEEDCDLLTVCCICRESVFSGVRTAAVYAFALPSESDIAAGGIYTTVSQMVMVHNECHNNAIRRPGGRNVDEWSKAMLHNAGAKCNVLTPIVLGKSSEEDTHVSIERFRGDIEHIIHLPQGLNRQAVFMDMCQLVDRFIYQRSFSDKSQGGGRESNMQYLGVLHLLALSLPAEPDIHAVEPRHRLVSFLFTELTLQGWNEQKHDYLRAALDDAQTQGGGNGWDHVKPVFFAWAFIDNYFNHVIPIVGDERTQWLRENLKSTFTRTLTFVQNYDDTVIKCTDFRSFCDVTGLSSDSYEPFVSS
ncbi:unnamed protein product [Caenorhabditis auriculariae]|uniref:UBR-type domain-containing protein n=1 Tax=Caenorhabditis auriculariae TaxID=2777116 RepID=A0A8S1HVB2_9PELO|nr:unnamed protein product [Caenorhabditis auriculariae]